MHGTMSLKYNYIYLYIYNYLFYINYILSFKSKPEDVF